MEITWLGHSCFRLRSREGVVLTDPCPPSSGYSIGKPTADIVTISHDHPAHAHRKAVSGTPIFIDAPGEYEVAGIFIAGIPTYHDARKGAQRGKNTAYVVEMDEVRLCHLGSLGHVPTPEQAEEMSGVDVLLVPVGGQSTIDGSAAADVVSLLEPRIVVPMHYKTDKETAGLDSIQKFLKEMGVASAEPMPKTTVARNNLPLETQVMVLDYKR
jgi:L-ascorbate metabolism protein UlaG (beta-lactamase superfamily)